MTSLFALESAPPMEKASFRKRIRSLRSQLLQAQSDLREAPTSALLVVSGVDGAGKGETVQLLNEWMDPRWIRTHAFDEPAAEESERPTFWRYWRHLPRRGEIALFLSAWYSTVILGRVEGGSDVWLTAELDRIRRFERLLADDGLLMFKLWLHLDADQQAARFRALEADPLQSWRVTPRDWENWSRSAEFAAAAEEIIAATNTEQCRWLVVDGADERKRAVVIGEALVNAFRRHLKKPEIDSEITDATNADAEQPEILSSTPSADEVGKQRYREELARLQGRLNQLHRAARSAGLSLVAAFEGRDASGKGGAIRRAVAALDPRSVEVVRVGPPSDEELMHHYLWRFWRRIPGAGRVTIFDRSWYGRVLAERVERLASVGEWQRAYAEINDFEQQLVDHGLVVVKFWLEIDRDEQKRRFDERRRVAYKRWKFTQDDRRNRRLWKDYDEAIEEMLARTSSAAVPWRIVPANDKRAARLEVLRTLADALDARLSHSAGVERGRAARGA